MDKKFFSLIIGGIIIFILLVGTYFIFLKGKSKKGDYQGSKKIRFPQTSTGKKDIFSIKGIGFKKESWAEYEMEGYGWKFQNGKREMMGKILVKLISLPIKGKEYYGIEIDGKEDSPLEGVIFAMIFEKDGEGSYYLVKTKQTPTLCMSEKISGYEDIPEFFNQKSIDQQYKVDLSTWQFVAEEEMTLKSGKKIKVFKFKINMEKYDSRDLWLSPQVPTYLVLSRETIEGVNRSIVLTNFGMDGGLPNFTNEDLKTCDSERTLPQLPDLPSEISKMFCQTEADCVCGVDKKTGKCAFGNKQFIDSSKQCPDFCGGIYGKFRIRCVSNVCTPRLEM